MRHVAGRMGEPAWERWVYVNMSLDLQDLQVVPLAVRMCMQELHELSGTAMRDVVSHQISSLRVCLPTSLTRLSQAQSLGCTRPRRKGLQPRPSTDLWPISAVVHGTCLALARHHDTAEWVTRVG